MSFHSPHLLWLLIPLVLLFSWELARHTARAIAAWPKIPRAWAGAFEVALTTGKTTASDSRPRVLLWFGLAFCIVALARPQWGVIEEQVLDQSREVVIAVDLSRSMLAQDVKPSRLERSKLLIQSLLDGLKGERVGLVLFAGTAFLQSPLSADYEVLREFLPALTPDYLPEGGSNYQAMLQSAIEAFGTSSADRYLIVLSDGESTVDDWKSLGDSLKNKGIKVIGLGVGTAQGSFIPDETGGFVKDERGAVVMSRLNSSTLQELAQTTGGAYSDASTWLDLPSLLKRTVEAGKKGDFREKNTARLIERFQWFLAPGLLCLLLSFWSEFPVRPRERAIPLAGARLPPLLARQPATAATLALLLWLGADSLKLHAADAAAPSETLAAPLSKTVARLAEQSSLSAKDCAELAETTLTYGQRLKSAQQRPAERVVHDALQAVDLGEKTDAKAADWPKLRSELQDLLKREDEQKKDDQKKDQQNKQDQKNQQDQQNQNQQDKRDDQQSQQDRQKQEQQQKQNQQQQQQQQNQPEKQNQDAFGDMKEQPDQKIPQKPPQPRPGTQKVGGQPDKPEEEVDPELAMPLQKLEQVRNQDSPAKLQQIMQGQKSKPKDTGKNW